METERATIRNHSFVGAGIPVEGSVLRTLSTGRCFVYVLPCREQDTLKIGYARDPWARMRTLHPRFHDFFDLERGALLEVDRVREARALEKDLKSRFADARDVEPLQIRERAGGRFEWFRGVHPQVIDELQLLSGELGYPLHMPIRDWLREQWLMQLSHLVDWSQHRYEQIEALHFSADSIHALQSERALRNLLDSWQSIGVPLEDRLDSRLRRWYRHGFQERL